MDDFKLPLVLLNNTSNDLTTAYMNARLLKSHWDSRLWKGAAVAAFKNGLQSPMVINTEYRIRYENVGRPVLFLERTNADGVVDLLDFYLQ